MPSFSFNNGVLTVEKGSDLYFALKRSNYNASRKLIKHLWIKTKKKK